MRLSIVALLWSVAARASESSESTVLAAELAAAHELRTAGSFTAADAAYRAIALQYPDRPEAFFYVAFTARAAGNTEAAIEGYRAALAVDKHLTEAHMNLAALLSTREGAAAEAVKHYRKALHRRIWPDETKAHAEYNMALALHTLGGANHTKSAVKALKRARKHAPDFQPAIEALDEMLLELGTPADEAARADGDAYQYEWVWPETEGDGSSAEADDAPPAEAATDEEDASQEEEDDDDDETGDGASDDVAQGQCEWPGACADSRAHSSSGRAGQSNAERLHAAAAALKRETQLALADPGWAAAARRVALAQGTSGSAGSEAQLLSGLVADLAVLMGRLAALDADS